MASRKLTQFLTTPSRVASALDWKRLSGAVLSLDIGKDRIGMAISSHPSCNDAAEPVKLECIELKYHTQGNKRMLDSKVMEQFHSVVNENKVCALVVGWPLQKEGRLGAPCGKVLHTLDCLVEGSNVLNSRPFCLWNEDMVVPPHADSFVEEDEWGRSPLWARNSSKECHVASKEQYAHHDASPDVAADILGDFCESQWPQLAHEEEKEERSSSQEKYFHASWLEDYEDGHSLQHCLL